jgi:hypothetical protein
MVTAHQEQAKENDGRPSATMGRRQELNVQLNQLIDAVILVLCLCGAHTIRDYLGNFDGVAMIEPFKSYLWIVVIIMPFGPLLLDLQGFYHFPLQKTFLKSSAFAVVDCGGCGHQSHLTGSGDIRADAVRQARSPVSHV